MDEEKNNISFFELNLKNKITTDYTEIDFQKAETSPRLLFRKRKLEDSAKPEASIINKPANKIKASFENYLDMVHETYFQTDKVEDEATEAKVTGFKFTSLDLLINPLRNKFVFETWSPYEIALFECCVCKFWKNFDMYGQVIRTKSKDEILAFYYYWKQSKYYKTWKSSRYRKRCPK